MKDKPHFLRGAFFLCLLLAACAIPFGLAQRTAWRTPANIVSVTSLNDSGAGSLRQALAEAGDGDTKNFALSGTIGLMSGELVIDKSVDITGQPQFITASRAERIRFSNFPCYA